ncbi:hypothetical protein GALMADRAFT_130827 [Galerina marginata CBS 339.88]|uniref:Uncharacterized protein n=1 Tax=Galerina marginata (strain CBS 339.88) TaxID=685588 RepID=A0A067S6Y7_GALM3|nr:hypothetical protein GALMADRAFT_130827 [Galerina marginata CBS 339.88]
MTSYLTRRACGTLARTIPRRLALGPALSVQQRRPIHLTPVVHKKKSKAAAYDDLFSDDTLVEEDLIKDASKESTVNPQTGESEPASAPSTSASTTEVSGSSSKKAKLTAAARKERFESQIKYIEPRLGRSPAVKNPRIKRRALFTLTQLASSEDELRRVAELLPKYREAQREVMPYFAEAFVRRCQELRCPPLALSVFGNFARYNLPLTQPAAQWLVHSLYVLYPLDQLMVATALFPVYNLPPISEDLPTASMVAAACYKHATPPSLKLAEGLKPFINAMLREKGVTLETAQDLQGRKKKKWIAWSLHKANKAAERHSGKPFVTPKFIPAGFRARVEQPTVNP